jgi:hypothetical protein
LLAAWRDGRRAWQRYYGRWLPQYMLRRLARGDGAAAWPALRLLVTGAPATLEGVVGYWLPAIVPAAWRRPEWPEGLPPETPQTGSGAVQ